jgi:hypothetical protein
MILAGLPVVLVEGKRPFPLHRDDLAGYPYLRAGSAESAAVIERVSDH